MTRWAELVGATTLLTRLPAGRLAAVHPPPASCTWAYPVVGLLVGGIGAGVLDGLMYAGLSQPLAAVWAVAATVLVTGGLHEDGLADTADGLGGGRTRERKLAIMRDSRIGSYGALALALGLALRIVPLAGLPHPGLALVCAAVLGRGGMLLPLLLLRPARADGLAVTVADQRRGPRLAGLAIMLAVGSWSPVATGVAVAAAALTALLSHRQLGGYTGDTLGAAEQIVECAALSALAA